MVLYILFMFWFLSRQLSVHSKPIKQTTAAYKTLDAKKLTCNHEETRRTAINKINQHYEKIAGHEYAVYLSPLLNQVKREEHEKKRMQMRRNDNSRFKYWHMIKNYARDVIIDKMKIVTSKMKKIVNVLKRLRHYLTGNQTANIKT